MLHQKTPRGYAKISKLSPIKNKIAYCVRCKSSFHFSKVSSLLGQALIKTISNPLCVRCLKRDLYLLLKVKECIRQEGGVVSISKLIDLYKHKEQVSDMKSDPFDEAREKYSGNNQLTLQDVQRWLSEGFFKKNNYDKKKA